MTFDSVTIWCLLSLKKKKLAVKVLGGRVHVVGWCQGARAPASGLNHTLSSSCLVVGFELFSRQVEWLGATVAHRVAGRGCLLSSAWVRLPCLRHVRCGWAQVL